MHPTSPMEANSIRTSKILPPISRHCLPRADILQTEGGKKVSMLLWAHQYEFYIFSWSRREQVILWEASSAQAGTGIRGSSSYSVYSFSLFIPHVSPDIKLGFQVKTHEFQLLTCLFLLISQSLSAIEKRKTSFSWFEAMLWIFISFPKKINQKKPIKGKGLSQHSSKLRSI